MITVRELVTVHFRYNAALFGFTFTSLLLFHFNRRVQNVDSCGGWVVVCLLLFPCCLQGRQAGHCEG
jgi:hypothetical protein